MMDNNLARRLYNFIGHRCDDNAGLVQQNKAYQDARDRELELEKQVFERLDDEGKKLFTEYDSAASWKGCLERDYDYLTGFFDGMTMGDKGKVLELVAQFQLTGIAASD